MRPLGWTLIQHDVSLQEEVIRTLKRLQGRMSTEEKRGHEGQENIVVVMEMLNYLYCSDAFL